MSHARPASAARRRRLPAVDYGWIIVAALCVTETIAWGIIHYGFPVFPRAMQVHATPTPHARRRPPAGPTPGTPSMMTVP